MTCFERTSVIGRRYSPRITWILFSESAMKTQPLCFTSISGSVLSATVLTPIFHSFWDDQIGRTLRLTLNGTFIRDSNHETSTGLLCPDRGFLLHGHCVFRGEEKLPGTRDSQYRS